MCRLHLFRALALFTVVSVFAACSDKDSPTDVEQTVSDDVFEQVSPTPFDGVDDIDLREKLEIKERGGTFWAMNNRGGVVGKFFSGSNVVAVTDEHDRDFEFEIRFGAIRRGQSSKPERVPFGKAVADGNVVRRRGGSFEEYFANHDRGIEHGLVVTERPNGNDTGRVFVDVEIGSEYRALTSSLTSAVFASKRNGPAVHYRDLKVFDAKGRALPAFMWKRSGGGLQIEFNDDDAVYPVVVDPILSVNSSRRWPEAIREDDGSCLAELHVPGLQSPCGLGLAVDVHGDVMVVGDRAYGLRGAVHVYVRDRGNKGQVNEWSLARTILDPGGPLNWEAYGWSVAVAERSGTTVIVVGDPRLGALAGAAEVLHIPTDQLDNAGAPPTRYLIDASVVGSAIPDDETGYDVDVYGNYVIVGQPGGGPERGGAAYLLRWDGTDYLLDDQFVTPNQNGVRLGHSVAISDSYVIAGEPRDSDYRQVTSWLLGVTDPVTAAPPTYTVEVTNGATVETVDVTPLSGETITEVRQRVIDAVNGTPAVAAIAEASVGMAAEEIVFTGAVAGESITVDVTVTAGTDTSFSWTPNGTLVEPQGYAGIIIKDYVDLTANLVTFDETVSDTYFGWDVDVAGLIGVVGAPGVDGGGSDFGEVVRIDIAAGPPATFTRGTTATGAADNEFYGTSVATNGEIIMASSPGAQSGTGVDFAGSVEQQIAVGFSLSVPLGDGSYQTGSAEPFAAGGPVLGYDIAIDPTSADPAAPVWIAGMPGFTYDTDENTVSFAGYPDSTKPQGGVLFAEAGSIRSIVEPQANDQFAEYGYDVDIHGQWMVVSAPGITSPKAAYLPFFPDRPGVVYIYRRTSGEWRLFEVVEPGDQILDSMSGFWDVSRIGWDDSTIVSSAVAVHDGGSLDYVAFEATLDNVGFKRRAIILAELRDEGAGGPDVVYRPVFNTGAFDFPNGIFVEDSGGANLDMGELSLDISEDYVVFGAPSHDVVYRVEVTPTWPRMVPFFEEFLNRPPNFPLGSQFGASVAINDSTNWVAVGAPFAQAPTNLGAITGGVAVYEPTGPSFLERFPSDGAAAPTYDNPNLTLVDAARLGTSVAFEGGFIAMGAPGYNGGEGAVVLSQFVTGPVEFQDWTRIGNDVAQPLAPGPSSRMGHTVDLDVNVTGPVAATNDWAAGVNAMISFVYSAGTWSMNDISIPDDRAWVDDTNPQMPNVVEVDGNENDTTALLSVMVGGYHLSKLDVGSETLETGSLVFAPMRTPVIDDDCDGVDDDADGIEDDDACGGLGQTFCTTPLDGTCLETCTGPGTCATPSDTCIYDPLIDTASAGIGICISTTIACLPTERLRNGECLTICNPTNPTECNAGETCFVDPANNTEGLCIPEADICDNPGFRCGIDTEGEPERCDKGECIERCDTSAECDASPGGRCVPLYGDITDLYCDYADACAEVWCDRDRTCYEGLCYKQANCDGDAGSDECATTDPRTGDPATCYLDVPAPDTGLCMDTTGACAGVFCPPTTMGESQACRNGVCYERCVVQTDCSNPADTCDSGVCLPTDPCANALCPEQDTCYQGNCYQACDPTDATPGCNVGTDCVEKPNGGGNTDGICLDTSDPCAGVVCTPLAGDPRTCYLGECVRECMAAGDCNAGELCNTAESRCVSNDVCDNVICPVDDVCVDGYCYTPCDPSTGGTECGAGFECAADPADPTNGRCIDETVDPCTNVFCPPDTAGNPQVCYEGSCYPTCVDDDDCTPPNICYDSTAGNFCNLPNPCDTVWCPLGEICYAGSCFPACDTTCATSCFDNLDSVQVALAADLQTNIETAVVVGQTIPNVTPTSGTIDITLESGAIRTQLYTSYTGSTFTIPSSNYAPPNDALAGNAVTLDIDRCAPTACDSVVCPLGQFCMNGECALPCTTVADCPDSHLCQDGCAVVAPGSDCDQSGGGRCLPSSCDDVNCPMGQTCSNGVCGTTCTDDGPCATGEVCYDGACISDPCDPNPCPSGKTCYGGSCYDGCTTATVVDDCAPGQICDDGRCSDSPCVGVQCPLGQVCYEGSCYNPCVDDGDCTPPNLCFNNVCASDPCEDITCPLGEVCYGGSCAPPCGPTTACQMDSDCVTPDESCVNRNVTTGWGYCVSTTCAGDECWVLGCTEDADCATGDYCFKNGTSLSGVCLPGGCDPTANPECADGTLSCRGSACEGVQCPLGQICYEGSCYDPCVDNGDCTPPNLCFDGVCTDDLCRGTNCPLGQICYAGSCYDPCANDGDCTPPNLCFEGRCADDACTGVICPLGDVCIKGGCFEACSVNTDCSEFIGTGDFVEVASSYSLAIPGNKEGGLSWADFNKDGCLDVVVNTDGGPNTRYLMSDCNLPNPAFSDNTPSLADHMADYRSDRSAVTGDLNNDGYDDILRTGGGRIEFFLNRWNGVDPYDGSTGWGINSWGRDGDNEPNEIWWENSEGAGIFDFDGDQDLDFFVQRSDEVNVFVNDGTGRFTQREPSDLESDRAGDYCATADFDLDGDPDILCRFAGRERGDGTGKDMFRNDGGNASNGGNWTQLDLVDEDGSNGDKSGVVFCDYDNDGDFDLFWGGEGTNQFWEQPSSGPWIETGKPLPASGFDLNQGNKEVEGVDCGDVDNDGDLDLFIAHRDEDRLFINQLMETGVANFVANNRGIDDDGDSSEQGTMVDYDNDGDLDIYVNHDNGGNLLWRNPLTGSDYIMIRPRVDLGGGVTRSAIGATIMIEDPDGNVLGVREVSGGSGRGSQKQRPVHIGLQNGDNVPYLFRVQFPHDPVEVVERCIVPNTMTGYRVLNIDNTDADDIAACSDPNWRDNIVTPNSGEFCFADRCAANACDGIQCSSGFLCAGGNCVESCTPATEATDCPLYPADICYQGRCADATDPACDDVICPSNQTCYAGECFRDCASASDCTGNQICYQGRCADPTCNAIAGNCLAGEVCHQGTCFQDCSADPTSCPAGETCWAGRCATDSCAAMMVDYDANHIFRATGKKITADQYSRPYFWPRPLVGPSGVDLTTFAQYTSGSSTVGGVHQTSTARAVLYLDRTLADPGNGDPEGKYVLWLTHGRATAAQGAARANYQVRLRHAGGATLDPLFVDNPNESVRQLTDGDEQIVIAQITSEPNTTGGIALGPLPSASEEWTLTIDASFSGDVDRWEFFNPELGTGTPMKLGEQVTIRSLPISPDVLLAPEVGFSCDMPAAANLFGNCDRGVLSCSTVNLGFPRCDQAVFPANFEICDGEDNDCDASTDEPDGMRVPYVQFNQNDGWKFWVPADSGDDFFTDLNYAARTTDDRLGSTDYIGLEGMPMQATQKSFVLQHRNLRTGELTVGFLHGANSTGGSDRNVEMELDFPGDGNPGTQSFRDAWIAYYDDGYPAADEVPKSLDVSNFELRMEWQLDENGGVRESDGVGIRPNFTQYANGRLSFFDMEFRGTDGDNDDWTDDGLQWLMYQPMLLAGNNQNELLKSRELDMRVAGRAMAFTFCPAAAPISVTDIFGNTETCELGRYTCSGGTLSCGPADLSACNLCVDEDADGYPLYDPALCPNGTDCNDQDRNIYPGAPERCNGLDDDCDTQVDVKTNVSGTDCGAVGGAECGPAECDFRNICVCPDGPENPNDPPSEPCFCGSSLEPGGDAPAEPQPNRELFENRGSACSAAGGTPFEGELPVLLLFGAGAFIWRRRRGR